MKKIAGLLLIIWFLLAVDTYAIQNLNILIINLDVFKNDTVALNEIRLTFGSPLLIPSTKGNYSLKILDEKGEVLYDRTTHLDFFVLSDPPRTTDHTIIYDKIEYDSLMHKIELYHRNKLIFSRELIFCNKNKTCETQLGENYRTCPDDCPSGSMDNYCDMQADGRCDPDCSLEKDPDCIVKPKRTGLYVVIGIIIIILLIVFFVQMRKEHERSV